MTAIPKLFKYFRSRKISPNEVLWRQDTPSDQAALLVKGKLISVLEDEAGTRELINPGHLIGEFGM